MAHHCHAAGCKRLVDPSLLMCSYHWFKVPQRIKSAVWRHYRAGQETDKVVTHAYCEAARAAVIAVAEKENRTQAEIEEACRVYAVFDPGPTETLF